MQNYKMILTNKSVLVTGGAGFIGSNLCEKLVDQNNKVVCLDNLLTGKNHMKLLQMLLKVAEEYRNKHSLKILTQSDCTSE